MAYRKLTIRRMRPVTREGAKILNDLDGIRRRMKNWMIKVEDLEMYTSAQACIERAREKATNTPPPADIDFKEGG
jgi:hypothetical protein